MVLLEMPFFLELMKEFEETALNSCIFAKNEDDMGRLAFAIEARIIRKLLSRIEAISKDGQPATERVEPA